jgi:CheY-like chemotaxis protein
MHETWLLGGYFMSKRITDAPGKKILIVDDEQIIRDILSNTLIYLGYHVAVVSSGKEALQLFHQNSFDLVITDLNMPGIDGWSVATRVKEESPRTLVGLMTAQDPETLGKELEGSSVDFALFKPFTLEELEARLEQCWAITEKRSHPYQA